MAPTPTPTIHKLVDDLNRASAAFRADALHNRMTGAIVVLEGEAPDELADVLHEAGTAVTLLLEVIEQASKDTQ
jgi:hypothetical protein